MLRILSEHLIGQKASTMSDFELAYVLNKYNFSNELLLYDIDYGSRFSISNGKKFLKGNFLRENALDVQILIREKIIMFIL